VRDYDRAQLVVDVKLGKDTYNPGEEVNGEITVRRSDGVAFEEAPSFDLFVSFWGNSVSLEDKQLSIEGKGFFNFEIPEEVYQEVNSIAFTVRYQEIVATTTKNLIVAQPDQLVVYFYPETGYYVHSTSQTVFFQAWTSHSQSQIADFSNAKLIEVGESGDEKVIKENISTSHRGKGKF